ncbi:MAG TPA: hypothetical protein VMW33_11325 [Ilumatobacteraceae bacterium]|jgi:uncharacterized membrane protein|nr:hypothetical protein [Ilumatobacteraceae bacterium]
MPANPLTDPNWATETTDKLVSLIDSFRMQTTQKAVYAARGAVFGFLAAILGVLIVFIFIIGSMRGLQALLALAVDWSQAVYLSYFIVGGILSVIGIVLFRKRNAATT